MFMLIMLGIPLEGYQGTGAFMVMWTIGVLGGAFCWALFDPYITSYGASGGCYSLLGMHIADHILNWGDKKWRYCTLTLMALVVGVEMAAYWPNRDAASSTAHTVHIGGVVAGLLIGFTTGRNDNLKIWEYICCGGGWFVAAFLVIGSTYFWFGYNEHPAIASLWNQDTERPFCWIGYACIDDNGAPCPRLSGLSVTDNVQRQCVMCQSRECVEGYYGTQMINEVEHHTYCPADSSRYYCQFWRDGTGTRTESRRSNFDSNNPQVSFDLDWPPTKSVYQQTATPAPTTR
jgi:hypothetical protein